MASNQYQWHTGPSINIWPLRRVTCCTRRFIIRWHSVANVERQYELQTSGCVTVSVQWTSAPVTRFYCFCIRQNKCDKNKSTTRTDSPERDEPRVRASGETFISDTVPDQTPRREEFPWIEPQERRERTTARSRATAPNLNKTNEYITGLFYLSPNGFTS